MQIETARLRLRDWRDEDIAPFGVVNADPEVANWLGGPLSAEQNFALVTRLRNRAREHGFTFWALETLDGAFLGACGMIPAADDLPIRRGVEIGWRMARSAWGKGYATEGAQATLTHAWSLGLPEVQATTTVNNLRSRAVMERIGMAYEPKGDFLHPRLAVDHPLRNHVLYSIQRPA
jgi:RimJ/RimL family protein N-acetyltransferase